MAPRRYGWHGTLVPPFRLAPGVTPDALFAAAQRWAATRACFEVAVEAATLGRFVALRPADDAIIIDTDALGIDEVLARILDAGVDAVISNDIRSLVAAVGQRHA